MTALGTMVEVKSSNSPYKGCIGKVVDYTAEGYYLGLRGLIVEVINPPLHKKSDEPRLLQFLNFEVREVGAQH